MSEEKKDLTPRYVKQRGSNRVFFATDQILARGDFLPCDAKGNFLATGEMKLPAPAASPEGPAQDKERIRLESLREKARILKVRGWNNAKEPTLLKGIAAAEAEIAREAAEKAVEEQDAPEPFVEVEEVNKD